jgi:hypothetical protein
MSYLPVAGVLSSTVLYVVCADQKFQPRMVQIRQLFGHKYHSSLESDHYCYSFQINYHTILFFFWEID